MLTEPDQTTDEATNEATVRVSKPGLYLLRGGYALIGVGLAAVEWPSLFDHPQTGPLMDGVVTCMLTALSLLALLGLRYPLQLLPILLFELGWKLIWIGVVALPLWASDQMNPATAGVFYECLLVVVVAAVMPWRYLVATYVRRPGDRWR